MSSVHDIKGGSQNRFFQKSSFSLKGMSREEMQNRDFKNDPLLDEQDFNGLTQDEIQMLLELANELADPEKDPDSDDDHKKVGISEYLGRSLRGILDKNPQYAENAAAMALLTNPQIHQVAQPPPTENKESKVSGPITGRSANISKVFHARAHPPSVNLKTTTEKRVTKEHYDEIVGLLRKTKAILPSEVWQNAVLQARQAIPHDDIVVDDINLTSEKKTRVTAGHNPLGAGNPSGGGLLGAENPPGGEPVGAGAPAPVGGRLDPFSNEFGIGFNLVSVLAFGVAGVSKGLFAYYEEALKELSGSANENSRDYKNLAALLDALTKAEAKEGFENNTFTYTDADGQTATTTIAAYCSHVGIPLDNNSNQGTRRDIDKASVQNRMTVKQSEMTAANTALGNKYSESTKSSQNLSDMLNTIKTLFDSVAAYIGK